MDVLDADGIREPITGMPRSRLDIVEVFSEIESTNSYLMDQLPPAPGRFRVALADRQTAGRGRLDRTWVSPPSSGLYLSLAYTFEKMLENLPSLTLALGTAVAAALNRLGIDGIGVKWPNDIIARGGKLGGILTEARGESPGGVTVVAGIGLNTDLPEEVRRLAESSWANKAVDLSDCTSEPPSRQALSVAVIENICECMVRFECEGFAPFAERWKRYDWLKGKRITVDMPDARCTGVADGVMPDGTLIVNTREGPRQVITGDITFPVGAGDDK